MESRECKWYTDHVECPARLKPCDPEEEVSLFHSRKYVKGIASSYNRRSTVLTVDWDVHYGQGMNREHFGPSWKKPNITQLVTPQAKVSTHVVLRIATEYKADLIFLNVVSTLQCAVLRHI
uniref:Histone deacetylase domain-containing protein n=1 Tax=Trichuris muris TaxID=70415 RepID=A0A5S6Q7H6_TRIMR